MPFVNQTISSSEISFDNESSAPPSSKLWLCACCAEDITVERDGEGCGAGSDCISCCGCIGYIGCCGCAGFISSLLAGPVNRRLIISTIYSPLADRILYLLHLTFLLQFPRIASCLRKASAPLKNGHFLDGNLLRTLLDQTESGTFPDNCNHRNRKLYGP
jgi:hypothetical protein